MTGSVWMFYVSFRMSRINYLVLVYYLPVSCLLIHQSGTTTSETSLGCTQTICGQTQETLRCPGAQILVTNITSSSGQKDDVMLRDVKRACMGKSSCDVSGMCQNRPKSVKIVSYFCADKLPEGKPCTGSPVKLSEPHGFLQNPAYPAAGHSSWCHWRIEPQSREVVHLTIFDLTSAHRTQGRCDGGLHITAHGCGRHRQQYAELVCANDSRIKWRTEAEGEEGKVTIVSCGPVDVRLTPARYAYPLRFWLGYSVKDSVRSEALGRSLLRAGLLNRCPQSPGPSGGGKDRLTSSTVVAKSATMTTTYNQSVTSASGGSDVDGTGQQDSTMTVLIVLVCVIGVIALVLTIVLIVVCLKRRRPKVELIEHVYAVPSSCQTLSHSYLDPDDPVPEPAQRPRLVQAYSDVADARPPDQPPQPTPASPAYAEVEEICDVDVDEKTRKRFQFRFRKRPSVSSSGTSSLYEDVNPVPVNSAGASKSNAATAKNNTLPKYNPGSKKSVGGGTYTTGKKSGKGSGDAQNNKTAKNARESPVYVHVVDGVDGKADSKACQTSKSKTLSDKSAVAPLAAKFIANIDKSSDTKVGSRGKTEATTARLYPLQEGRVATLVSTLNRNKDKNNGVAAKEQAKVS